MATAQRVRAGTAMEFKIGTLQATVPSKEDLAFCARWKENPVPFNIDADPINANWLRWKNWQVGCRDLPELFELLDAASAPRRVQVRYLERLRTYLDSAPELLQEQVQSFLEAEPGVTIAKPEVE